MLLCHSSLHQDSRSLPVLANGTLLAQTTLWAQLVCLISACSIQRIRREEGPALVCLEVTMNTLHCMPAADDNSTGDS